MDQLIPVHLHRSERSLASVAKKWSNLSGRNSNNPVVIIPIVKVRWTGSTRQMAVLFLKFGCGHDNPVKAFVHNDLACQTCVIIFIAGGLDHRQFLFLGRLQFFEPAISHMDAACATIAISAANGLNSVNAVLNGAFHERHSDRDVNRLFGAVIGDIGHFHHDAQRSPARISFVMPAARRMPRFGAMRQ
nr:hypothetical protein [Sphingomonas sp. YR710]